MATSNEIIRDGLIQRQVDILGFSRGLGARLVRLMDRTEPQIRAQLRTRLERALRLGYDPGPATTKRLARIAAGISELMADDWAEFRELTKRELVDLAGQQIAFANDLVATALPVEIDPIRATTQQLRQIVIHTPIVGRPLAEWFSTFQAADQRRITAEIRSGLLAQETPVQISRRIFGTRSLNGTDGVRQVSRRSALMMAQTAGASVANAAMADWASKNRLVKRELYVATLDSRTTPICRSLDGNTYPKAEGPRPPLHPNCRSLRVPYMDGRLLGTRPAVEATESQLAGLSRGERRRKIQQLVGRVPAQTTYQQWLTGRSASFQNEVLGPTRGRLFRQGGIDLPGFVDPSGRQYTLAELRQRAPDAFRRAGI